MHVTDTQGGLDIETVGKHPLVTGAQPASPEITLVTVVLHVSVPFLKHEGDIDTSDIHLATMGVQPEEPAVENVTGPITELRLDKPVTELLCLVPGRRGVPRVEKEIHAHLCVKGPFTPHGELQGEVGSFQGIVGQIVLDDILYMDEIEEPAVPRQPRDASVEFRDVSFAYDSTPVLKAVSFIAHPGTVTALVGPSGAGKSTVAMLAARFWDIQEGEILVGGVPVKEISIPVLMDNVAFVFQDNTLFFDTIEENIRMGNQEATFEEVTRAAEAAQCHTFIEALPDGYQTLVGEGGTYLSGGEAQRIALARAILKDAPIILLDEATAFADPENEGKILDAFSHLTKGKTVLVIAHRLGTVTNADRILYMDKGVIAEAGTHEELLALGARYAQMWKTYNRTKEWTIGGKKQMKTHAHRKQ